MGQVIENLQISLSNSGKIISLQFRTVITYLNRKKTETKIPSNSLSFIHINL